MKNIISNYIDVYNYSIKHSSLGRITPMEALEVSYNKDRSLFKIDIQLFKSNYFDLNDMYRVGLDI